MQAFKISIQVTIDVSKLKWYIQASKSQFNRLLASSFEKKRVLQNAGWSNQRFGNYLGCYLWMLHRKVKFLIAFSTQTKGNKK